MFLSLSPSQSFRQCMGGSTSIRRPELCIGGMFGRVTIWGATFCRQLAEYSTYTPNCCVLHFCACRVQSQIRNSHIAYYVLSMHYTRYALYNVYYTKIHAHTLHTQQNYARMYHMACTVWCTTHSKLHTTYHILQYVLQPTHYMLS